MRIAIMSVMAASSLLLACKGKIISDEFVNFRYEQTTCADPWGTATTDSADISKVAHYLDSLQLSPVGSLGIRTIQAPEACSACTCKTGKMIYLSTLAGDGRIGRYEALGFRRQ